MDKVETYPAVPSPITVERIMVISTPPGPNAVEKLEIACPTNVVDAYPAVPKPATVDCISVI